MANLVIMQRHFKDFIVAPFNQAAYEAAIKVADSPGNTINPLISCGDVGIGKTHLSCAIGNRISDKFPECRLLFVSGEQFHIEWQHAFRTKKINEFRRRYSKADLLSIENINFFTDKIEAQKEVFHIADILIKQKNK